MDLNDIDEQPEFRVTFSPNLYLQRRGWVLDQLRREHVTQVLDVGCGEGELLACLCQPAPWLPPPPSNSLPNADTESTSRCTGPFSCAHSESFYPVPNTLPDKIANLHPSHLAGLDVSPHDLQFAVLGTAPKPPSHWNENVRWEALEVKLWQGGLESLNEEFVGVECITAMEVYVCAPIPFEFNLSSSCDRIEHLPEHILPDFAPVLLGVYHPRLLLVTTPNFTFNARFHPPDTPESRVGGYPDPTGRTDRIFRHHDHKFEWVVEEFTEWCASVADEWGYTVEVAGIGKAVEPDEWGRDEELGYASQVAKFKRIEGEPRQDARTKKAMKVVKRASKQTKHELIKTHRYDAHPQARHPLSLDEIGEAVKAKMQEFRQAVTRLEELWFENDIAVMCGGWLEFLIAAVDQHKDLKMMRKEGRGRAEWRVELLGGVHEEPEPFWGECEQDEWESEENAAEDGTVDDKSETGSVPGWGAPCGAGEDGPAESQESGWARGSGWGSTEAHGDSGTGW
ncbi:hypothetical protein OE88DRAFT_302403 [Heliocybe sulcata]|uniref:Small RNA 2'-O-methyltransferase n=1 Tax=Heliocybe sulcata TaxID=5364 RepID=A0A5C3MWS6_9AGAM|nr:hypothetical protein OE88DRAFT_302403 [Heliocybe sulcata]